MDINKEGSVNDFDALNQPPAQNQEVEQMINNVDLCRNPTINSIEPQDQYLEVIQKKQQIFGDEDDFKRLLNQVVSKTNKVYESDPSKNHNSIKKKMSQKKEEEAKAVKAVEQRKEKILKTIEPHVKNYKIFNNANSSDSQVTKLRAEFKQKTFKFLLYGVEQLKLLPEQELSEEEKRITKLIAKDPYALAKSLTTEIDVQFFKNLNNMNQFQPNKKYKSFMKNFTSNMADDTNLELRRKVLTRTLAAKKMVTLDQQQFYPKHIRQKLIQRQNILLRQATAQQKPATTMLDQNEYQVQEYETYKYKVDEKKEEVKKEKYKYLEESTFILIRDMLKKQQIIKMKNMLEQDLRKDIQDRLIANIGKVFDLGL